MPHGAITRAESEQPPVTGSGILISLRTPTDCHHHRQASSYPYGLPEVAPLSSSSLIFSPREQTADCHQALKQVLTTPCVVCYAWHQALHILAGSHRLEASLVPGTHMGRHSFCWSWNLWTVLTITRPPIPCAYTALPYVMSKKHRKYPWPSHGDQWFQVIDSQLKAGRRQR